MVKLHRARHAWHTRYMKAQTIIASRVLDIHLVPLLSMRLFGFELYPKRMDIAQ